ncbi:MAG: undecaprenyl-diphosphate phosphatase [Bacteroidales bacterium]|nr:undecaprenyl-diphosphate phosphatase [Bacteroidales bacterium]
MSWLEALILGIVQGLTEYLPVSSSGHLAIGQALFGMQSGEDKLAFTVLLHIATVLSTLVVLWREVVWLFSDLFKFRWNEGTRYTLNILISMIPVGIVGLLFKDWVEAFFGEGLLLVGICLLITALLLAFSHFARPRQRESLSPWHAFVIGLAQAVAVLPGLSRSGSTIATGLLLGNRKETLAQFSFLMVIPPILGEALLDIKEVADTGLTAALGGISPTAALIGFVAAFVVGCLACRWMIDLVKKGRLIWFAVYCAVVGLATILIPLFL